MTIHVLRGHRGGVDFDGPIEMSEQQHAALMKLLREMYVVVEEEQIEPTVFRSDRLGDKLFLREWTSAELRVLLDQKENEIVCELLGRTWMSVDIKRGEFIPEFLDWAHRKGYNITRGDLHKYIEEFLKEQHLEVERRRRERSTERTALRRLQEERERQKGLIETTKILIGAGHPELRSRIQDIKDKIKDLDRQIAEKGS